MAARQADQAVDIKFHYLGDVITSILQLTFNLLLSKVTNVNLNRYWWLIGVTICTIALRLLFCPSPDQEKLALIDGGILEDDLVNEQSIEKDDALTLLNDEAYEGSLINDKQAEKEILTLSSEEVYEGGFVNNKRSGKGKLTFANGEVYEGDFLDGKCTGQGKLTWPNGSVYEGDFIDDMRTGKGKLTMANGEVHEGDFVDGVMVNEN